MAKSNYWMLFAGYFIGQAAGMYIITRFPLPWWQQAIFIAALVIVGSACMVAGVVKAHPDQEARP